MARVTADMTMSLDGFIAGPNDGPENPLGDGGGQIHEWVYGLKTWRENAGLEGGATNQDNDIVNEILAATGAVVMGRRMFDNGEVPWGDSPPFHAPVFVVTHQARETLTREGGTSFTFVTDGVESALDQARASAGDKSVDIAGGANLIQQCLRAGVIDEFQLHISPILLGDGVRLFDQAGPYQVKLERLRVVDSPNITHLKFRLETG